MTTVTVENDEERPLTYRETRQDTIAYDEHSGPCKITASGDEEKQHLCDIFAATILQRATFFQRENSRNLYTLDRIIQDGPMFQLAGEWDTELLDAKVTEIQITSEQGRWALTARDSTDAVAMLFDKCPEVRVDGSYVTINYVKLRFVF